MTKLKELTSTIKAAIILQIVAIVITDLLLWVGEDSKGLTHLLEFLLFLLLHLWSSCTVAVCKKIIKYLINNIGIKLVSAMFVLRIR